MSESQNAFDAQLAAEDAARFAPPSETVPEQPAIAEPVVEPEPEPSEVLAAEPVETEPLETPEDAMAERIKRAHIESREAKRRARELERELEVLRGTRTETRDETVQREAQTLAQQIADNNRWNEKCNKIATTAFKQYADFGLIVDEFRQTFPEWNGIPRPLTEAAMEAAEGREHELLHWLGKNMDEAERIAKLPPASQGVAMARIADKLKAPKPVSKAPPPIRPAQGASSSGSSETPVKDPDKMSMAEFVRYQDEQDRKRRSARFG